MNYRLVKDPRYAKKALSIVEEVTLPNGIIRYQWDTRPLGLVTLGNKGLVSGHLDLFQELKGWAPALYQWAQRNYRSNQLNPNTIEFSKEAKVELILLAYIYAAHNYTVYMKEQDQDKKDTMRNLIDSTEAL